jgi:hypothetical protein
LNINEKVDSKWIFFDNCLTPVESLNISAKHILSFWNYRYVLFGIFGLNYFNEIFKLDDFLDSKYHKSLIYDYDFNIKIKK